MHLAMLLVIPILFLASIQEHHCQQQCLVFSSRDNLMAEPGSYLHFTFSISSSCYSPNVILQHVKVYNSTNHTDDFYCGIAAIRCTQKARVQRCFCNSETREFTVLIYKHAEQNETWTVVAVFSDESQVVETVHIGVKDDTPGTTDDAAGTSDPREASSETSFTLTICVVAGSVTPVLVIVAIACFLCRKRSARTHGRPTSRMSPPSQTAPPPSPAPPPAHAQRPRPIPPNHPDTEGHYSLPYTHVERPVSIPMGALASKAPEASQSTTAPSTSQTEGAIPLRQLSCPDVSLALCNYGYWRPGTSK